ncbi:MAG TPA: hypothetical protein VLW53_15225, partial [Candidatus Eisenbacteria bacterium]|nr:hypothetical protein [Candidatus Eisenbacteria bacterium]
MSQLAITRRAGRRYLSLLALGLLLVGIAPGMILHAITAGAVDCGINPIPCENQQTGTDPSVWDTPNGDA